MEDPCDLERGPLVRFACLRDQKICDIVMVLHHAVADGLSAVILMGDLLRYLGNPSAPVEELALQPSMGALIPKEVYDFLPPPEKILASFQSSERQGAQSVLEMPPPRFHVLHRSMDKSQLKPLLARCKENRVTVHGALGAAVLLASQAVYEDGQTTRTLQSPVSVRHLLPADLEGHFGMFITIVKEPVECHTERDFWDITRDVSGHLHELVNPQKLMMRLAATESVADYMQREGQMKLGLLKADYDASVSNLGRLTIPTEYGAVKLRSLIGPTFGANKDEKVIGVNTLDGQLNLTLCFRKKIMEPEEGERLLDLVMERLS